MQLTADAPNLRFSSSQRALTRVHRVAPKHQIVGRLACRTEHEASLTPRDEVDGFLRGLEDRDLPSGNRGGRMQGPLADGHPGDIVTRRRFISPALAIPQVHLKV